MPVENSQPVLGHLTIRMFTCFIGSLFCRYGGGEWPLTSLFLGEQTKRAQPKWSIWDHTYAKQHLYRRALEANSPEARGGTPTNPDRHFDAEQGEIDQDPPGNNPGDGAGD